MKMIKPPNDFHAGSTFEFFKIELAQAVYLHEEVCLDLSEVIYMDTDSFRLVFDFMPRLKRIIPPKDRWSIKRYDEWLDSKKGLSK